MTTDPQKIKARLAEVAADARYAYDIAIECINALQDERDEFEAIGNRSLEKVRELDTENADLRAKLARDFPCCDAPVGQQEPERLTVHALNTAPVGSKVTWPNGSWLEKSAHGSWMGVKDEDVLILGDDATLTHPTPAPVTAETIRQSEPGSTWESGSGRVYEWTGEGLSIQGVIRGLGSFNFLSEFDLHGPWSRSTAAPRGDYGKKELPTEPDKNLLDYADEWRVLYRKDPEAAGKVLADGIARLIDPAPAHHH